MTAGREIKRRIKSISNTKKIAKAMELVAAARMRKTIEKVLASRPYALTAWEMLHNIAQKVDKKLHPLIQERTIGQTLLIIFATDKGLCGGLNTNLWRKILEYSQDKNLKHWQAITIGKKARQVISNLNLPVMAHFENLSNKPAFTDILPISKLICQEFATGKYQQILMLYPYFVSVLLQEPTLIKLLPITGQEASLKHAGSETYVFEPNIDQLLDKILIQLLETRIYQALLETAACEHSARMTAMKNANEAAGEMINDLTLNFNQARQAAITAELADISTAKIAMEQN